MRWLAITFSLLILSFSCLGQEWIPFKLDGGHVKIPVKVADIETYAMLDSGSQINAINKAFVNKHKLTFDKGPSIKIAGVFGTETLPRLNNIPLEILGASLNLDGLPPLSLGHHSTGLLLGAGFFSSFVVQIDYPNSKMRILPRGSINLKEFQNIKMRSQRGSGAPIVNISINKSKPFWITLDTGNSGGLLIERSFATSLELTEKVTHSEISSGANNIGVTEHLRVNELKFGPYTLENVLVSMPAEGQSIQVESNTALTGTRIRSKKSRGIIGYDVLKHFVITIDYKGGHAHIGVPD